MKRKTLVMWSGGLDSTYGLVRLLRETNDDVYAHHISRYALDDTGKKKTYTAPYEDRAISFMHPILLSRYREFHFDSSSVNLTSFRNFARDTSTAMFFSAHSALSHSFCRKDRILLSMNSDEDKSWNPGSEIYQFLRAYTVRILRLIWGNEDHPQCFLWPYPPTKQEEVNYLPDDIFKFTASCRNPSYDDEVDTFSSCQRCPECITLSSVSHNERIKDALQ